MKHPFAPYELALLAKEKGFNEPCIAKWHPEFDKETPQFAYESDGQDEDSYIDIKDYNVKHNKEYITCFSAPLYQQLVDWFREEHDIEVVVLSNTHTCSKDVKWEWSLYSLTHKKIINCPVLNISGYYEALNAALTEAFKLINP